MNPDTTKKVHPLIVRLVGMRDGFAPELSDTELSQMAEIADANPSLADPELNALISKEFDLQTRYNARQERENDIVAISNDLKAFVEKWQVLPMLESRVVAGMILENLNLHSAVIGAYIETLKEKRTKRKAKRN